MREASNGLPDDPFAVELPPAPYPGLRPFEKHEWPVFFGRETMTTEVIDRLMAQSFVVVHGDSGCGKSSLIRAGVQAQLEQEQARSGRQWITTDMRPGESPLWALAGVLAGDRPGTSVRLIRRLLNRGIDAAPLLGEALGLAEDQRLCVLVDQFEELFRFAKESDRAQAQLFTDVLVGLERRPVPGLYLILTMRSEFMGHCARYRGLAEAVNRAQYLLPRMERPALVRAIREPVKLYGGEVEPALADALIADAGGGQDQLPLIQHGLLLLWSGSRGDPDAGAGRGVLGADTRLRLEASRLRLTDRASIGLEDLLSDHADAVMDRVAPVEDRKRRSIVEHLFRALTDISAEGHAIRRPQTFRELRAVTGADGPTLAEIIDAFRADGVSFLAPYGRSPIGEDTKIDISHEALIRCWRRIADGETGWLHREFQDGLTWQSLRVQAEAFERDPAQVLSAAAVTELDAWIEGLPSRDWALRYLGAWDSVERLMTASRAALEAQARRDRRWKWMLSGALVISLMVGAVAIWAWWKAETAQRLAEDTKREAQIGDSWYREAQARQALKDGLPVTAMQLALAGLPPADRMDSRPWVQATADVLYDAMLEQRERLVLRGHEGSVTSVAWSPDGDRVLSGSGDQSVRIWDASRGEPVQTLRGHEGAVSSVAWSPDGDRILSGSTDNTVRIWDAASGKTVRTLRGHENFVFSVAWSPDGDRILSGSWDKTVRIWDASSGELVQTLRGHEDAVTSVAWSPDGDRILSGSWDGTVRIWDASRGEPVRTLRGDEKSVLSVAWSPDGDRILSGSEDGTVQTWDASSGELLQTLHGHEGDVQSVAWSSDGGRVLSGSWDKTIRIWEASSGELVQTLRGHADGLMSVAWSPDGDRILSGSMDKTLRIWDASRGDPVQTLRGHEDAVTSVAWSPDGRRVLSGSVDKTLRIWDASSGEPVQTLRGHEHSVLSIAWSPDGARVLSGSGDQSVRIWDAASGELVQTLRGHELDVSSVAWSPDGRRVLSGSGDNTVRIWDAASGKAVRTLRGHEGFVWSVAWSPDGGRLLSGSLDKTLRIWDALSGEPVQTLRGHEGMVLSVAWSPDGDRVLSGSGDNTVRIWDASNGEPVRTLSGHERSVLSVAWSPDGRRVLSGSEDKTVRIWDASSGELIQTLRGHERSVWSVAWSPDGGRILSGSRDSTVRIASRHAPNQAELIRTARERLPRELTPEEKKRYHIVSK